MVHPSDTAPALVALDAKVTVTGRRGKTRCPARRERLQSPAGSGRPGRDAAGDGGVGAGHCPARSALCPD
jgi:hypothetical protein